MLTKEERRWIISNSQEYIKQNMAICDEEIKTRKLQKFLGAKTMDFDIEYLVIRLHDIAREVEQKVGFGALSKDIRACADRLSDINQPSKP